MAPATYPDRRSRSPVLRVGVDGDQLQGAAHVHVALVDLLKLLFEDLQIAGGMAPRRQGPGDGWVDDR